MSDGIYADFDYSVISGTTGIFEVETYTNSVQTGEAEQITGTFGGQNIIGLSDYGSPTNILNNSRNNVESDKFFTYQDFTRYEGGAGISFNGTNGLSFALSDGVDARIYIVTTASGVSSLDFRESSGVGGPLEVLYSSPGCFSEGVYIRTPDGQTPVESLQPGDLVSTASGAVRLVKWVGRTIIRPRKTQRAEDALPVRVLAHAFGEGTPSRDLIISPGHALCLEGVLINACDLINGATVVQEEAEIVHYYHVELDSHDILIADGMLCESYLDDGNRSSFDNGADHITLHGRIDRKSAATCLPLVKDGPLLQNARALLLLRALEMGWRLVEDAGLSLSVDGVALPPVVSVGNRHWFIVPEGSRDIRLLSNATQLNRLKPFILDDRRLGVAVAEVRIDGQVLPLDSERFGPGFYPAEHEDGSSWRWMSGEASLKLNQGLMVEVQVHAIAPTLVFRKEAVGEQSSTLVTAGWTKAN